MEQKFASINFSCTRGVTFVALAVAEAEGKKEYSSRPILTAWMGKCEFTGRRVVGFSYIFPPIHASAHNIF